MSDAATRKLRGPVETLQTEFAEWDSDINDWKPGQHLTLTSFRPDGNIESITTHNLGGSAVHSRRNYDSHGRIAELHSWIDNEPGSVTLYLYDETGRQTHTRYRTPGGAETDLKLCSYDEAGRNTEVRFLFPPPTETECSDGNVCHASLGYGIEGTDNSYSAPGARKMTTTYDGRNLPSEVVFYDADENPAGRVVFQRDSNGRLLSETQSNETSPFRQILDRQPPEDRERMAALLQQVLGDSISSTSYAYDDRGRLIRRELRMGNLGGTSTTYRYEEYDDPVEETSEHISREADLNDAGIAQYSSEKSTVQHNRFDYIYDNHGNWTERTVLYRLEPEAEWKTSSIERRTITYHKPEASAPVLVT